MTEQLRALIVEDNQEDIQLVLQILRQGGFHIAYRQVSDASSMKTALEDESWDVILAGYALSRFSALSALNVLQQSGRDIPFIVIADTVGEKGAITAMRAGAHDYVVKNNMIRLVGAVRREIVEASVRQERESKSRYLDNLNQITRAAATILDDERMLRTLANLVTKLLEANGAYISFWDEAHQIAIPAAAHDLMYKQYGLYRPQNDEITLTQTVVKSGYPLVVANSEESPFLSKRILQKFPAKSLLALPLIVGEQRLGALIITYLERHSFTADEILRGEQAAGQIALAVARMRLLAAEREQRELAETLHKVANALNSSLDREQVLNLILDELVRVVAYDSASIMLLTENVLHNVAYRSLHPQVQQAKTLPVNQLPHFQVMLHTGEPLVISDTAVDERWQPASGTDLIRCWLGVPMMVQDKIIGILNLNHTQPEFYTARDLQVTTTFAGQAAIAIENARLYAQQRAYAADLEHRVAERTRALAEANERLQELDRLKSKFVSDVTHELRTPVTSLKLYLDLMGQVNGDKQAKYLKVVQSQANRLGQLISDILSLSKLEVENTAVSFTPLDFNNIVKAIVEEHRPQAQAANLQLDCQLDANLPPVLGHRNQLVQMVTNLLTNAIHYTSQGSVHVTTTWDDAQQMVRLMVKDSGMGIPERERPLLFDRFYRGERTGQLSVPGTGLGLAIVKEIVEMHQGKIDLESQVDTGSTFYIWLLPVNTSR